MIAVCLKWIDQRSLIDGNGAGPVPDARFAGVSLADQAALEWALRCGEAWGLAVTAISAGPAGADAVLRDALAAGAAHAVRIDAAFGAPSHTVAAAIANQVGDSVLVCCGDFSVDRGSGSVPAFIAAALQRDQALGLVSLVIGPDRTIDALRRLDGGRRERLSIRGPAVVSVEGSTARLRRASLRSLRDRAAIEVHSGPSALLPDTPTMTRPYRPRARVLAGPVGGSALDRIKTLTASAAPAAHGDPVLLDPPAAAERILTALREWGALG